MNGMDELRTELIKRGFNRTQADSKVVAGVVSVLAENMAFLNADKVERELISNQNKLSSILQYIDKAQEDFKLVSKELENIRSDYRNALSDAQKEIESYLLELNKAIEEAETPESRDLLRKAQMFVNSVDVDTKYDNTAFIIGLSAILSEGAIQPVEELKKINKKLFKSPIPITRRF